MEQIFEEYMPIYAEVTRREQAIKMIINKFFRNESGVSDDDLRRTHLSHEAAEAA